MYVTTSWLGTFVLTVYFLQDITASGLPDSYRVAGLFEEDREAEELAFRYAMEQMNMKNVIGPGRLVIYDIDNVVPHDSFQASKEVCRQIKEGIAVVFGPMTAIPRAHVQSICNTFEIPHLQAQWDSRDPRDYFSVSVYPHYLTLSRAYADLIKFWGWKRFTVIYDDNAGLIRLQEVLKATEGSDYKITVRKLGRVESYVSLFKDMKEKEEYRIIIDCDVTKVGDVLHEALKVHMVSEYYHYLFTTLDLGLVDLNDYKYGGANITAYRLINPEREAVANILRDWEIEEVRSGKSPLMGNSEMKTEIALIYDAAYLFTKALAELAQAQPVTTEALSCSKKQTWSYGNSLLNYMKSMDFEGLSGRIHFINGKRVDFNLDIVELTTDNLQKIGTWEPNLGVNITKTYLDTKKKEVKEHLANKTLRVVTVIEEPYVMKSKDPKASRPYEGFMIDLLDKLQERLKFNYSVYEAPDKKYGGKQSDGSWNGMVGQLMLKDDAKRADLAAAGMSITYDREQVVDFTKPFLNLGITILYKKPEKTPPMLFSFLSPLSIDVWVYMIAAYLCVSFMLFVIARFSPYEWCNPHPCNENSDIVENQFTILNSLWFTIGSLMQQGSDIAPRAISTRLVGSIWWFFTLIMISSYTANLAAFLTVERMETDIASVDDLAKQTKVKYGTLNSGSTKSFFKHSDIPVYKRMWSFMSTTDNVFVDNTTEGVKRVETSNYAYLGESTSIDYQVQRHCKLQRVGGLLDSKGYGLATPRDSPYTEMLSMEVIHLQENQDIQKLYTKWWIEKSGGKCNVEEKKNANALEIANVGGVFVLLAGGLAAGLVVAIIEFMWKARKNAKEDKQSLCSEMAEEFRFAVRCCGGSSKTLGRKYSKDIVDNGVNQFMPLTGIPSNNQRNPKELYA